MAQLTVHSGKSYLAYGYWGNSRHFTMAIWESAPCPDSYFYHSDIAPLLIEQLDSIEEQPSFSYLRELIAVSARGGTRSPTAILTTLLLPDALLVKKYN